MKTLNIKIEVYDESTIEDVERAIDTGLNDAGIDCSYNVMSHNEKKEEFEIKSKTFFNDETESGHATIFMNRKNHGAIFEIIFKKVKNGNWQFHYERNVCLTKEERLAFEKWFKLEEKKEKIW